MRRILPLLVLLTLAAAPARSATPPIFLLLWGSGGTGPGQFTMLEDLEVGPDGTVYTIDSVNKGQRFSGTGGWLQAFANATSGSGQIIQPNGIAVDAAGNIYVGGSQPTSYLAVVKAYDNGGAYLRTIGLRTLSATSGIATDAAGNLYIADYGANLVRKYSSLGVALGSWGGPGSGPGQFNAPMDVTVDASGSVNVTDGFNSRVQKFTGSGTFVKAWGGTGTGDGQFKTPVGISVDGAGHVYVVDIGNKRVQEFDGDGNFLCSWGPTGPGWSFNTVVGVSADASGNVFVADQGAQVLKFGAPVVSASPTTWGRLKSLYR